MNLSTFKDATRVALAVFQNSLFQNFHRLLIFIVFIIYTVKKYSFTVIWSEQAVNQTVYARHANSEPAILRHLLASETKYEVAEA